MDNKKLTELLKGKTILKAEINEDGNVFVLTFKDKTTLSFVVKYYEDVFVQKCCENPGKIFSVEAFFSDNRDLTTLMSI